MNEFKPKLSEKDFMAKCQKGICCRNTIKSSRCKTESKQKNCYSKWIALMQKKYDKLVDKDSKWIKVRERVYERDGRKCQLWEKLTQEEKNYVLNNYGADFKMLKKNNTRSYIPKKYSSRISV